MQPTPLKRSVLLVEDDPNAQWELTRMLTVRGHRVVATGSGHGALALLSTWSVDLVVLAERLRGIATLQLARLLRDQSPHLPVVLLSSPLSLEARIEARIAGVSAFVRKPVRVDQLLAVCQNLMPGLASKNPEFTDLHRQRRTAV